MPHQESAAQNFQTHFLHWNLWILIQISLKFIPDGRVDKKLHNSLALKRQQAIIQTYDGLVFWYIYACMLWEFWRIDHVIKASHCIYELDQDWDILTALVFFGPKELHQK